ncbi:MAG: hypothetical protein R3B70_40245 [Polyangiaceae bacterium]
MNNVETSRGAIVHICPPMLEHFSSGSRASMFDLALCHAAARAPRVYLRPEGAPPEGPFALFVRRPGEDLSAFPARLVRNEPDEPRARPPRADVQTPTLALLFRGDLPLAEGSSIYALFRDALVPTLAASDLLS